MEVTGRGKADVLLMEVRDKRVPCKLHIQEQIVVAVEFDFSIDSVTAFATGSKTAGLARRCSTECLMLSSGNHTRQLSHSLS